MEMRQGNATGARTIFLAGIAGNCTDVTSLYHALGLLELKEGHREEAAEVFRRGIELGLRGNREVSATVCYRVLPCDTALMLPCRWRALWASFCTLWECWSWTMSGSPRLVACSPLV